MGIYLTIYICLQNEELITTIHESPQHQTIQAHVVEEIMPEQLTEVTDVKEVINQLLPTRKRKPRTKKPNGIFKLFPNNLLDNQFNWNSLRR